MTLSKVLSKSPRSCGDGCEEESDVDGVYGEWLVSCGNDGSISGKVILKGELSGNPGFLSESLN